MCKKLITVVIVGFMFTGFMSSLHASDMLNFTYSGNGARAGAMGYAFTGISDDATAIAWNTAGLTQLYSMEACAIGRLGFGSCSWDLESAPDIEQKTNFQLNFLSFVLPFKAGNYNIVGGVALRKIYDFGSELTYTFSDNSELRTIIEGGINAISPAIAVQINDMFSVGTAFNIYYGSTDYYWEVDGNKVEESISTSDYSGTSIDLGIMVKPNDQFSIGANLNFPYTLTRDVKDDKEYEIDVPFFFSVGAAFKATDQLTLAFDYHSRTWSNSDVFKDADFDTDLNSIHAGLEYLITSGDAVIPVRVGFYTNPIHDWVVNSDGYYGDQISNNVLTLGAGLIMGSFIFDAAFEFESSSYETFEDDFYNLYSEEFTVEKNNFRMTLGGSFHFGN